MKESTLSERGDEITTASLLSINSKVITVRAKLATKTRGTASSKGNGISSKDIVNELGDATNNPASTNELEDAINALDINSGPGTSRIPSSD